jgi:acetyltransferase-like isoleucine patch superfamily enzyme
MGDNNDCMGEMVKKKLKYCGDNVTIYPLAKIVNPEFVEIGSHTMIDDFTFINGGRGLRIGRYVHVAAFSCIIGGGKVTIGDCVVIGYGVRLISGTDDYHGGKKMTTALPEEQRSVIRGNIIVQNDAFVGVNTVIHPNVTIGEGAIIGSNSLVLKDVKPWTINVGSPCQVIGSRICETIYKNNR